MGAAGELDQLAPGVPLEGGSPYEAAVATVPLYQARAAELEAEASALEAEAAQLEEAAQQWEAAASSAHPQDRALYAAQAQECRAQAAAKSGAAAELRARAARIREQAAVLAGRLGAHVEGWEYHSTGQDAAETAFWA
jgi:exonuclease VII small subunit